ncbi:MAG: DciA family protein [Thermodesulfobacteriota bacterium]
MKKPQSIHSILEQTLKVLDLDFPLKVSRLLHSWKEIVGEPIALQTQPYTIRNRILFIHVSHSVWIQHLQFLKSSLIEKINEFLGDPLIVDIRFKLGKISTIPSSHKVPQWEKEKLDKRMGAQIEQLLRRIEDEKVKKILMAVFIKSAKLEKSRLKQRPRKDRS